MTHTGAIGYLVIVIWPFTFKNDKQILAGSQTIPSSWTILEWGGIEFIENDKQGIVAGSHTILTLSSPWTILEWAGRLPRIANINNDE